MELLERDGEREALEQAIAESRSAGRVVVVAGEAGIGKTALVSSLAGGHRVLWGACDPLITPRPMGPLRDGRLAMSSRTLAWSTLLAPAVRLQEHAIAQTPLQRRAGLADVEVAVGKAGGASVRHLEQPVAADLWERLRIS